MQWHRVLIVDLSWASLALQFLLCARLASTGLWRTYPRFMAYVGLLTVESVVLSQLTHTAALYRRFWVVSRIILLTVELFAVLEIFRRWTNSYPGIGRFGQRLLAVLLTLATGLTLSTLPISASHTGWNIAIYVVSVANRAVHAGLATFLILMLAFFMKFGGPVAPNLERHTWAMTVFALTNAVSYFVLTARSYWQAGVLLQSITTGALMYWLFALRRSGERIPPTAANPESWAEAEELNRQLQNFASSVRSRRSEVKR